MKKIYLANPYGFSKQQRELVLPRLKKALEDLHPSIEVWEPFERNNQVNFHTPGWAYKIGQADLQDVEDCDAIFAVVNGIPPDEGVMVELGAAIAWNKRVFLFRDDFRKCTDSEQYPLNLMIFSSLSPYSWEDSYYTSIENISSPAKALWRWVNEPEEE